MFHLPLCQVKTATKKNMCHVSFINPLTKLGPSILWSSHNICSPQRIFAPDIQKVQIASWHQVPPGNDFAEIGNRNQGGRKPVDVVHITYPSIYRVLYIRGGETQNVHSLKTNSSPLKRVAGRQSFPQKEGASC